MTYKLNALVISFIRILLTNLNLDKPEDVTVGPADTYIVVEYRAARLTCEADSNPDAEWSFRADSQSWTSWSSTSSEEVYSQIPRSASSGRCRAKNTVGQEEDQLTIEVHCELNSLQ